MSISRDGNKKPTITTHEVVRSIHIKTSQKLNEVKWYHNSISSIKQTNIRSCIDQFSWILDMD